MAKIIKKVKYLEEKMSSEEFNNITKDLEVIEKKAFNHHALKMSELKYEFCENPFSVILFCYEDDVLVGYMDFWITFDSATIFRIGVNSDYQRQGIGSLLMDETERLIKETNEVFAITLEVRQRNKKAINLYSKYGFDSITIKECYYEDGENAIYMVKGI